MSGLAAVTLKAKPDQIKQKLGEPIAEAVTWVQDWAWAIVPTLLLLSWIIKLIRNWIGDPAVREEVRKRVNEYRNSVFSDRAGGSTYQADRRITLFKRRRFCFARQCWPWSYGWPLKNRWPWDGWLIPEFRSGNTPQLSKSTFRVPEGRHREAEGIAGRAWESDGWLHIPNLPDVKSLNCTESDIAKYAEATQMDIRDIKNDPPQGRAFAAIRVEVQGKGWGSLVIDTRAPDGLDRPNKRAKEKFQNSFDGMLSILLPRI